MWLVLLSNKSEAAATIKKFQAVVEVETGRKLRALRTDRGGEFTAVTFAESYADHGVHRQLTAPYSPQQNGVVERRNQTMLAMAQCLLKARGVPSTFWGGGGEHCCVHPQPVSHQSSEEQDPLRGLARGVASSSLHAHVRVHSACQGNSPARC